MAELFGFRFERLKDVGGEKFTLPAPDDGTVEIAGGGFFGQVLDTDGRERTELDLVRRYRDIAQQPECDSAIEDIVNEGIVANEMSQAISIVLDGLPYPTKIKMTFFVDGMLTEECSFIRSLIKNTHEGVFKN
jgi:hypothetical protein